MKNLFPFTLCLGLFASTILPASAAFSSLYVFGDSLSASHDGVIPAPGGPDYYGLRWSNGRVWVEVLAQRQGLTLSNADNDSYFDHNSSDTLTDVKNFTAPPDASNDLVVVWVCNADMYDDWQNLISLSQWQATNTVSLANHFQIITNLYAKGVRTLVLPNAVDISKIPAVNISGSYTNTARAGCLDFNARLTNTLNQALAVCPGLTIYSPDYFTLLNHVLTNAAYYGLTNALQGGLSIDAYSSVASLSLSNGIGPKYIFWDPQDPSARLHAVMADVAQQMISPSAVGKITALTGSNRLDVVNYPAGLSGFVDASATLAPVSWSPAVGIASTNMAGSFFVPASGSPQFYRLRFPYAWSWP